MELVSLCLKMSSVGALFWLDRTHAFQIMISRPIVTAPLMGFLLGNPLDGLLVGILLELLWTCFIPVGTTSPPDETVLAILTTGVGSLGMQPAVGAPHADILYGLALFLPTAYAAQRLDMKLRASNNLLNRLSEKVIAHKRPSRIGWYHISGMGLAFVSMFFFLFFSGIIGFSLIQMTFPLLPAFVLQALRIMVYIIPLVGIGAALNSTANVKTLGLWALSFILFVFLLH